MPTRLLLKPGAVPDNAAQILRQLVQEANAITPSIGIGHLQSRFLQWVEQAESQLHYLTHDFETVTMFDTARARMIRELDPTSVRPWPLVNAEVKLQISVLERMLADLRARTERAAGEAAAIVIDTHVLLHYKPLDELPWQQLVGSERVRLILPLRVIEELDQKKYAARGNLARRARRLLPRLRAWVGPGGSPGPVVEEVSLEVMVDPGPRRRPADADEEILDSCRELAQFGATDLKLLTADTAMSIRAEAEGIPVIPMPESYLRSADSD